MRTFRKLLILAAIVIGLLVITAAADQKIHTQPRNASAPAVVADHVNAPAVPFTMVSNHDHQVAGAANGADVNSHPADHHNHFTDIDEHDAVAITDMHVAALHHFGVVEEEHDAFGTVEGWSPNWELRYIDYGTPEHSIRVYHATSTHNHAVRYVSIIDAASGFYQGWQVIH